MKIVLAPDSFKGSLSAIRVAEAMNEGVQKVSRTIETELLPVADGGEGTMEILVAATKGWQEEMEVTGPLGTKIKAAYGVLGDGKTCVIEIASASGLAHVKEGELNPFITTTYGTGELMKQALDNGYSSFIVGLGGSATNDGGAGMLQALGAKLLNDQGEGVQYGGGNLGEIATIDLSTFDARIATCNVLIASDVQNPLIGIDGASHIFGPQKGAKEEMVKQLDQRMAHWANKVEEVTGIALHDLPGAGAAGGIGGAFMAFFPSTIKRGIDVVLNSIDFGTYVKDAVLVLTGEGQVDGQTASGKAPLGVAQAAKEFGVPTIIVTGSVGDGIESLYEHGVVSVHSIIHKPMTLEQSLENAAMLIEMSTEQIVRSFLNGKVKR